MFSTGDVRDPDATWQRVETPTRLDLVIRGQILNALAFFSGHQELAARSLGISPRSMTYQMQRYGIPTAKPKAGEKRRPRGRYAVRKPHN